jgi:uncharacterized RDD family membrane protein YckC
MARPKRSSTFDPHETSWSDALAGLPLAPFSRRAAAFMFDFALCAATFVLIVIVTFRLFPPNDGQRREINFDLHSLWSLVWIVAYFGASTWLWNGRTPGKRLLRLRVASLIGPKVTLWQAIERALGYAASALEAGFGFMQFFIARNRQCVHDRIAETIVILDKPSLTPTD